MRRHVGAYTAVGTGFLHVPLKTATQFHLVGTGKASLEVNGVEVIVASPLDSRPLADVALNKGYNRIRLTYHAPADGAASVRLLWSSATQAAESLPPEALFYPGAADAWWDDMVRKPRVMIDSLHCRSCHSGIEPATVPLRELPSLENAGGRLHEAWITSWILDPKARRKDATMPHMLGGFEKQADREQAARDLAAWLGSLGGGKSNGTAGLG